MLGAAHVSGVWQADGVRFTSNLGVKRDGLMSRVSFHYQLIGNGEAYMSNLTAWDPTLGQVRERAIRLEDGVIRPA